MTEYFKRIEAMLAQHQMPLEYENWISHILCNDCEKKSYTKYHFLYHKCSSCSSFNTKVLHTFERKEDLKLPVNPEINTESIVAAAAHGAAAIVSRELNNVNSSSNVNVYNLVDNTIFRTLSSGVLSSSSQSSLTETLSSLASGDVM